MKVFMFNHAGSLNHGCEAIVRGTVNILSRAYPECEFKLSSYNPETDEKIDGIERCLFKTGRLSSAEKLIAKINLELIKSEKYALRKMYAPIARQAEDCDICLSIGGDTYCYGDNPGIQILTEELKKKGKKVVLWGASLGEEDLTEDKLKNLSFFDAVFARESLTYSLLKEKNANEKIFLNADPAFCLEREEMSLPDGFGKDNTVGLNISPLVAKKNPAIFEAAEGFIKYVIDSTTLNVLLVPHVVENGNNDYEFMYPLFEKYKSSGRIEILPQTLDAKQYKDCISKLRFFIGARTHATVAAYSSGVPTYVIGYSVKSRGIALDLFGNENYVMSVENIESEVQLIAALALMLKDEEKIKETLKRKIPGQIKSAMQMGEILKEL